MKLHRYIFILFIAFTAVLINSCSGSKKYFKAAVRLEEQGLVNEAAEYYMESLQRKPKNTDARIKLKEVGQKYVNNMSSHFFREFNTGQYEQSLETFDKMKAFTDKSSGFNVQLNYPQAYADDYNKALEIYLSKNYNNALENVNQNKFDLALKDIAKIKKYNSTYKNTRELEITATCEPLYVVAIKNIENKNYSAARNNLNSIKSITEDYKDVSELNQLMEDLLKSSFMIFKQKNSPEKDIEDKLLGQFIELSYNKNNKVNLINNTPFSEILNAGDISNAGNTDLIQAIRKASGADYFFVFDVANKQENTSQPTKGQALAYEKVIVKRDTLLITEYRSASYNEIRANRTYSYDFKYKLINAETNQIVTSKSETCIAKDEINYNVFLKPTTAGIDRYFPYNPLATSPVNQFNPNGWRNKFSARRELRSFVELKNEADNKAVSNFNFILNNFISKK
jgi:hypothetical protein